LLVLCSLGQGLAASEVVIVASGAAKPYLEAQRAAQESLAAAGHRCLAIQLEDLSDAKLRQLASDRPDAALAIGSGAAAALHRRLDPSVRLIYCMVADPDGAGLTSGRTAHGVSTQVPLKAQFELIAQALPNARVVGTLYRDKTQKGQQFLYEVRAALPDGWRLEAVAVDESASVAKALEELFSRKADIVWTVPDATIYDAAAIRALLLEALRRGVPVYGFSGPFVHAGAMLGMGVDPAAQGRQAAELTLRILGQGAAPPGPAVEPPRTRIILNAVVAERLSVELPKALLAKAGEVIRAGE
jgi:putative ABC transport system substrate-binding protein